MATNARCAENVKGKYLGEHKTNDIDMADSIQWRIFKFQKHELCKSPEGSLQIKKLAKFRDF